MTEDPFIDTAINSASPYLVNREAHSALRLLSRRSSDEDEDDHDEDEMEEDDEGVSEYEEGEQEPEDEVEDIEEENENDTANSKAKTDESIATVVSLPSFPFAVNWGRGKRAMSIVTIFSQFLFTSIILDFRVHQVQHSRQLSLIM